MALINNYKITIINWEKHNKNIKKGHSHFMVSKGIFSDHKISQLTPTEFQMMLYLFAIRADSMSSEFTINYRLMPTQLRLGDNSMLNGLRRLESLQILTVEKIEVLYNRIEENRREEKRREILGGLIPSKTKIKKEDDLGKENRSKIWEAYKQAYFERYKVEALRNAKVNSAISQLAKRLGHEEAILLVRFYLTHNKQYYLQTMHDISACVKDAEALRTQRLRGRTILDKDVRDFAQQASFNQLLDDVERGGF